MKSHSNTNAGIKEMLEFCFVVLKILLDLSDTAFLLRFRWLLTVNTVYIPLLVSSNP